MIVYLSCKVTVLFAFFVSHLNANPPNRNTQPTSPKMALYQFSLIRQSSNGFDPHTEKYTNGTIRKIRIPIPTSVFATICLVCMFISWTFSVSSVSILIFSSVTFPVFSAPSLLSDFSPIRPLSVNNWDYSPLNRNRLANPLRYRNRPVWCRWVHNSPNNRDRTGDAYRSQLPYGNRRYESRSCILRSLMMCDSRYFHNTFIN